MKIAIFLEKYSDWLEASHIFKYNTEKKNIDLYYINNDRNDASISKVFEPFLDRKDSLTLHEFPNREKAFKQFGEDYKMLQKGDWAMAPFIRYKPLWELIKINKSGVTTCHLSECFPDSFGKIGYRLGYRGLKIKTILAIPYFYRYAFAHMPDCCFYPLYPQIRNPFVKTTLPASLPSLSQDKLTFLREKTQGERRPLLITGFGFNLQKMAKNLNLTKYIATSKHKEIIIDGICYPIDIRICAEEVLSSGLISSIIGYNSSVMAWATHLENIEIKCYESRELNKQYGLFGYFSRKTLKKMGIKLLPYPKEFIDN